MGTERERTETSHPPHRHPPPGEGGATQLKLSPGEAYVFKLGPLQLEEGRTYFYAAVRGGGALPVALVAPSDAAGIPALARQLGPGRHFCEPRLAKAAAPLGFTSRAFPRELREAGALMAIGAMLEPGSEAHAPPDVLTEFLAASKALWKAAPWRFWSNLETARLTVAGEDKPREVCLLGSGGQEFGFALYEAPGTVAAFTDAMEEGDLQSPLRAESLALTFNEQPAWVRSAVRQALSLAQYPLPLRVGRGHVRPLQEGDLLRLVAVARALASLTPMHRSVRGEARRGAEHIAVEVHAPLPMFTGELVGSSASPFAVVLDAWEPWTGFVAQAREAIRALPGSMRPGLEDDFGMLVERKQTHFPDDPRLFSNLQLVLHGPLDFSVRLEGRLTPAMRQFYGA